MTAQPTSPGVVDLGSLDWELTRTPPGAAADPSALDAAAGDWIPAVVPGTAARAMAAAGRWNGSDPLDTDTSDWWWRAVLPPALAGPATLEAAGIATIAEVWVGGRRIADSASMFRSFAASIDVPAGGAPLYIVCRALEPLLRERRPRPAWKTRLVRQQNVRWFRTSLLGRMPGWSPTGAPVGPWRGLRLFTPAAIRVVDRRVEARCLGAGGEVLIDVTLAGAASPAAARLVVGSEAAEDLRLSQVPDPGGAGGLLRIQGRVALPEVERWWPHGYGAQPLHPVAAELDGRRVDLGRVGFREFGVDRADGAFTPSVNGVPVFFRGACWVAPGGVALAATDEQIVQSVRSARDAGLLMLRITGTTVYESAAFWDACDELGIMVWQDAMIANLPPPETAEFVAELTAELTQVLGSLSGRPSLAVVSGGSEVEQQAAMLGLPAQSRELPVLRDVLAGVAAAVTPAATYVTSSPTGGEPPFRPDQGVAHYFGVGAYLRPLSDARSTGVRFAAECLAFANPPEPQSVEEAFGSAAAAGHTPEWKRGVARDAGAPWDFEDVRDVYVEMLFGVDIRRVRFTDPGRYLDLGRAAVAEAMSQTMAEWRRADSGCAGALILNLTDLVPGAGWGLVDSAGRRKSAWYALREVCAPLAVRVIDEGMSGPDIRIWNDSPEPVASTVTVTLYNGGQTPVATGSRDLILPPAGEARCEVEEILGGFRDAGWAYRFGPPSADVVAVSVQAADGRSVSTVHLPAGAARGLEPDVGLIAEVTATEEDLCLVTVSARRFAQYVAFDATGWVSDQAWFHLAPGETRVVRFSRAGARGKLRGEVRALNSAARSPIR